MDCLTAARHGAGRLRERLTRFIVKRTLLATAISAYFFFYLTYAAVAYVYELIFGPFEAYPPFEIAIYVGPIISFGFCLCALLGAICSLERVALLSHRCLYVGTASMALASSILIWLGEAFGPHLDSYLDSSGWLSDIGVVLAPWLIILCFCVLGFVLACRLCLDE